MICQNYLTRPTDLETCLMSTIVHDQKHHFSDLINVRMINSKYMIYQSLFILLLILFLNQILYTYHISFLFYKQLYIKAFVSI